MTLTEFLLARIAEDGLSLWCGRRDHDSSASASYPDCWEERADCDSRDKREWRAKRRIVAVALPGVRDDAGERLRTLRILATVYRDHPDYSEGWLP